MPPPVRECVPPPLREYRRPYGWGQYPRPYENTAALSNLVATGAQPPVVSTFTSPEERAIFGKCLRKERAFVWVCPGGIPAPLPRQVAAACAAGGDLCVRRCRPVPA